MTDLARGVEKAFYVQLVAEVTGIKLFQNVPENTPPPVQFIGDMVRTQEGGKASDLERFDIDVITIVRANQAKVLHAKMDEAKAALDRWVPPITEGVRMHRVRHVDSRTQLLADGQHYYGSSRFEVFAEAA